MTDEVVVFACQHIKCARNTAQFQRSSAVCDSFDTYILSRREVCEEVAAESEKTISVGNGPVQRLLYPLFIIACVLALRQSNEVKYVHTTHSPQTLAAGAFLQLLGFVWIADVWDDPQLGADLDRSESITRRIARTYNRVVFSFAKRRLGEADLIVFALAPELLSEYGIAPDAANVLTTTNGVDLGIVPRASSQADTEPLRLVYIGPVTLERGIETLLGALRSLPSDCPSLSVELIGNVDSETSSVLDRWDREAEDQRHEVITTGYVEHERAMERLSNADIGLCLLSTEVRNYNYAYPIKVFEYLAAGVPTICTRTIGTERILTDGESGILVESGSTEAVMEAIDTLARDEYIRRRIASNARKEAGAYTWEEINDELLRRIRSVTG